MVWCGMIQMFRSEGGRPGLLCYGGRFKQLNVRLIFFGTIIHVPGMYY